MFQSVSDALRFLFYQMSGKRPHYQIEPLQVSSGDNVFTGAIYRNKLRQSRGTILVITGLSVHGISDPRIVTLCNTLAAMDYTALLPLYEDIENFRLDSAASVAISLSINAFTEDKDLCPDGSLSVIAPSFSGGLALLAAAGQKITGRINSICTIGTYGSMQTVVPFLLEQQDNDEYGRMIILKNFIHYSTGRNQNLERALELAYHDGGYMRQTEKLVLFLKNISENDLKLFNELRNDPEERMKHWKRIISDPVAFSVIKALDVLPVIGKVSVPVSFIHGRNDDVISFKESELLYSELKKFGTPCRLSVTSLVSHGNSTFRIISIREIISLIRAFAFFFNKACSSSGRL